MEAVAFQNLLQALGSLAGPVVIVAAASIWVLLATGVVGRVAQYFEELPHRRSETVRSPL